MRSLPTLWPRTRKTRAQKNAQLVIHLEGIVRSAGLCLWCGKHRTLHGGDKYCRGAYHGPQYRELRGEAGLKTFVDNDPCGCTDHPPFPAS